MRLLLLVVVVAVSVVVVVGSACASLKELRINEIPKLWAQSQSDLLACHLVATTRPVNLGKLGSLVKNWQAKWGPIAASIENTTDAETPQEFFGAYLGTVGYVMDILGEGRSGQTWGHLEVNVGALDGCQRQFLEQWPSKVSLAKPLRESWFVGARPAMEAATPGRIWKRLNLNDYPTDFAEEGPESRKESLAWLRNWVQNADTERSKVASLVKAGKHVGWREHFEHLYALQNFGSKCKGVSAALQSAVNAFPKAQFNAWVRQSQTRELSTPESKEADRILAAVKARLREETR